MTLNTNNTTAACSGSDARSRWPAKGDLMIFLGKNGYDHELTEARIIFEVGKPYVVQDCNVQNWSHSIRFEGHVGWYNGVMFERAAPQASAPRSASAGDGVPEMPEAAQDLSLKHDWCPACHRGWSWRDPNARPRTESFGGVESRHAGNETQATGSAVPGVPPCQGDTISPTVLQAVGLATDPKDTSRRPLKEFHR